MLRQDTAAATAGTLIHEYAHALLHVGVEDDTERGKRELEAEAVAYIVGRQFGLNMDGSTFYLATWATDDADTILDRLDRISHTATTLIEAVDPSLHTSVCLLRRVRPHCFWLCNTDRGSLGLYDWYTDTHTL